MAASAPMTDERAGRPSATVETVRRADRRRLFMGRESELAAFRNLLAGGVAPRVLAVGGVGGVGKSTLLDAFEREAAEQGIPFTRIDATEVPPQPSALQDIVHRLWSDAPDPSSGVQVLAIDTMERLAALDDWLRRRFLAELPANTIVVLAGRWTPGPEWWADPATSKLLITCELEELSAATAESYLQRRGVDAAQHAPILRFARGHPLALSLAADRVMRHPDVPFDATRWPELPEALVQWLLRDVSVPHRDALYAASVVRHVTRPVLAALLDSDTEASHAYDWLTEQHFIRREPKGLTMHEIVRDAVSWELRYRDLAAHHALVRRAIHHYLEHVEGAPAPAIHETLAEALYTLRHEPYVQRNFQLDDASHYLDEVTTDDQPFLATMVETLEGRDARNWLDTWTSASPAPMQKVVRSRDGTPVGFALALAFGAGDLEREHRDPAVMALQRYLRDHAPLREQGKILLLRFGMVRDTHQQATPAFFRLEEWADTLHFTPGLSFIAVAGDAELDWWGVAEHSDLHPLPETHFSSERRRFLLFGHDLRKEPPFIWVRKCTERFFQGGDPHNAGCPAPTVLRRPQFETAVREALQQFRGDAALRRNPLAWSYLLRRSGHEGDPEALRSVVTRVAREIDHASGTETVHPVLHAAYFDGRAETQLEAAMGLGMSERTFRRRLREAERAIIEHLWAVETERG